MARDHLGKCFMRLSDHVGPLVNKKIVQVDVPVKIEARLRIGSHLMTILSYFMDYFWMNRNFAISTLLITQFVKFKHRW